MGDSMMTAPSTSDCYLVTRESMKHRVALLINVRDFNRPGMTRYGSEKDVEAMDELLRELGYQVFEYNNLSSEDIEKALKSFAKHPNLKHTDSVFVVLMSHGNLGTIVGVDENEFKVDKVYEILNNKNCSALRDKPKVLLIQACRGNKEGHTYVSDDVKNRKVHLESDFTSLLSCTPHTVSYRNREKGSFFIQNLVKVFKENYRRDHISDLFRKVMRTFDEIPEQMPTIERDTMKKHFFLVPDSTMTAPSTSVRYLVTRESMKHRKALLINIRDFSRPSMTRYGSEKDVEAMDELLRELGYQVLKHNNLSSEDIEKALKSFAKHPNLKHTDSVFVVLMSHGNLGTIVGVDENEFKVDKVYEILNNKNCSALRDKPKVLLIQACRGNKEGYTYVSDDVKNRKAHLESDFTSLRSCTPHTVSYRNREKGSFFIQNLVKVFKKNYHEDHVSDLFRKVMRTFDEIPEQMPTIERDTMKKHFFLVPETNLRTVMKDLGLEWHSKEKLSLSKILQIDDKTLDEEPAKSKSDLPWYFLKELMMVNVTARNMKLLGSNSVDASETTEDYFEDLLENCNSEDMVNPLDVITALFLCSDGFVRQEMALKMSMCQFSVPLLLPSCDSQQCTLMLWAMRDIVKQYRPEALSESKSFSEERIVLSNLPMVSFVRLGECSLSKSETLNKLLSNPQQYHNIFVHHNMECGNSPRRISNGLTEITWYLPGGKKTIDIFSQPVAVANLRGDIESFETQYAFLCQASAAVFVFIDKLDAECTANLLSTQINQAQIFLVGNNTSKQIKASALKEVTQKLGLTKNSIIIRNKEENDVDFVNCLRAAVKDVISKTKIKKSIEQMAAVAHELGIRVDEDSECQTAKQHADNITAEIQDPLTFKKEQLPLQGQIWKDLTSLEKEDFCLRKLGSKNIEQYKSDLKEKKEELRQKQNSYNMSKALMCFIQALSLQHKERSYFLKWMRINLDNMSRIKLSELRELYKEKWKSSQNKEEIKQLDQKLTNSSLGIEHFFREMGQIYEASRYIPETDPSRQQLNDLPKLCAQMLLDGFPLELVDGDASNIPLQWVSDVLSQLNEIVSPKNKILVVTVLGVQSTGKSTLLNTMFGVQFAVSSGRCTRGAFMLFIKVHEEFKKVLKCDFIVIIDTEGLKSPELAQLEGSDEHDNELATLVVGLSDLTIVNIAMENITETKDILQIVVHAFLRMKEVGKKPKCHFVHQNVSDVSAHEKNLRDRKLLLQQLDEMTQAAARMEKKEEYKSFADVMDYNPDTGNCYIPGLWNGNPPMAPVNVGYSEAVYDLKKNIIQLLAKCNSSENNISDFNEWMRSLWNAVKHENFIFSFRNSLVADAYMRLCTEFNKWEWEFKKEMYSWGTIAETQISNFGNVDSESPGVDELLSRLKTEADAMLNKCDKKLLDNLTQYFTQTEGHVHLVEGHKAEFQNSAKSLRQELKTSVFNRLSAAADNRKGMVEINQIMENHTEEIEKDVIALINECRKTKHQMTDQQLNEEFYKMWSETLKKLTFSEQKTTDVFDKVSHCLRTNLSHKGSHASELLSQKNLQDCGQEPFKFKPDVKWWNLRGQAKACNIERALQQKADSIIGVSKMYIHEKMAKKGDYHDAYIQEILIIIDQRLQNDTDVQSDIDFEVDLKQHICGFAARKFEELHQNFVEANDPYRRLMKNKEKFCADFKDVFHERDQCQKKAVELCYHH